VVVAGPGRRPGRQRHRHLAQRSGQPISFWEFTKYGAVVAVATMLVCMPYLWLRYFIFA
jgi:hypothetical protein